MHTSELVHAPPVRGGNHQFISLFIEHVTTSLEHRQEQTEAQLEKDDGISVFQSKGACYIYDSNQLTLRLT